MPHPASQEEIGDDVIGFHAQQAVEKLLKAVLAERGIDYPRVHDIDRLDGERTSRQVAEVLAWASAEVEPPPPPPQRT